MPTRDRTAVRELPPCDNCSANEARWDAKTVYGAWGYLCDTCLTEIGVDNKALHNELFVREPGAHTGLPFDTWLDKVDRHVQEKCGLGYRDLTDKPYGDWHADGLTPQEAADLLLEQEGFPGV